ncbi:DUF5412 family protein [Candidatus Thiodiazotropha sp. CDECU1]|uniref:DUF5412 family protein n=1 Tax=Candidatus Thiodiazotropha sp. CDECU1 TaxID=3065865 RepID=UPI0029314921|nr:DUF5412 family protein [Candidatus Thiodiazotropha sp. CDECU1]
MKTWVKRIVIGSISIVSIALMSGYLFIYIAFSDMCRNDLATESKSPDKKYKALIFQRDCGATTGFSTQISIIDANEELENKGGNILTADGHPDKNNFKISWVNSDVLLIKNTQGAKTIKKESSLGRVNIRYE